MRPLTEEETKTVFAKLANYCSDLKSLIAPLDDGDRYVLRLNHSRVYYVRLSIANMATSVARDQLLSLGTCLGKMTKTGKFRLHITALPILAENARHKIWVKENGAQPFLYGSNGMLLSPSPFVLSPLRFHARLFLLPVPMSPFLGAFCLEGTPHA